MNKQVTLLGEAHQLWLKVISSFTFHFLKVDIYLAIDKF